MPFRIPTNRVELLRVLSAKADVSQTQAAAVWNAMLALARDGVRKTGSFPFPGLGKLERVHRAPRTGYDIRSGRRIRIPGRDDLVFRVSKLAKNAILAARPAAEPKTARSARKPR